MNYNSFLLEDDDDEQDQEEDLELEDTEDEGSEDELDPDSEKSEEDSEEDDSEEDSDESASEDSSEDSSEEGEVLYDPESEGSDGEEEDSTEEVESDLSSTEDGEESEEDDGVLDGLDDFDVEVENLVDEEEELPEDSDEEDSEEGESDESGFGDEEDLDIGEFADEEPETSSKKTSSSKGSSDFDSWLEDAGTTGEVSDFPNFDELPDNDELESDSGMDKFGSDKRSVFTGRKDQKKVAESNHASGKTEFTDIHSWKREAKKIGLNVSVSAGFSHYGDAIWIAKDKKNTLCGRFEEFADEEGEGEGWIEAIRITEDVGEGRTIAYNDQVDWVADCRKNGYRVAASGGSKQTRDQIWKAFTKNGVHVAQFSEEDSEGWIKFTIDEGRKILVELGFLTEEESAPAPAPNPSKKPEQPKKKYSFKDAESVPSTAKWLQVDPSKLGVQGHDAAADKLKGSGLKVMFAHSAYGKARIAYPKITPRQEVNDILVKLGLSDEEASSVAGGRDGSDSKGSEDQMSAPDQDSGGTTDTASSGSDQQQSDQQQQSAPGQPVRQDSPKQHPDPDTLHIAVKGTDEVLAALQKAGIGVKSYGNHGDNDYIRVDAADQQKVNDWMLNHGWDENEAAEALSGAKEQASIGPIKNAMKEILGDEAPDIKDVDGFKEWLKTSGKTSEEGDSTAQIPEQMKAKLKEPIGKSPGGTKGTMFEKLASTILGKPGRGKDHTFADVVSKLSGKSVALQNGKILSSRDDGSTKQIGSYDENSSIQDILDSAKGSSEDSDSKKSKIMDFDDDKQAIEYAKKNALKVVKTDQGYKVSGSKAAQSKNPKNAPGWDDDSDFVY